MPGEPTDKQNKGLHISVVLVECLNQAGLLATPDGIRALRSNKAEDAFVKSMVARLRECLPITKRFNLPSGRKGSKHLRQTMAALGVELQKHGLDNEEALSILAADFMRTFMDATRDDK
jgi:hypothetical protein